MKVVDLDKILVEEQTVKLHGNTHIVKPMTAAQLFKFADAWRSLGLLENADYSNSFTIQKIFETVHVVIPSITLEDIEKATPVQMSALIAFIVTIMTGEKKYSHESGGTAEKKTRFLESMLPL